MLKTLRANVLLVDDESSNLQAMSKILSAEAYNIFAASNGAEAIATANKFKIDLIVSDLRMPEMNGIELLRQLKLKNTDIPVILLSAYGTIDDAVEAMRLGAVNFLSKPINRTLLLNSIYDALAKRQSMLQSAVDGIIGQCESIQELKRTIRILAPTNASVLVTGDSGTGKEVVAQLIHRESARIGKLVSLNCAAIPDNLLESELFGYERGAFTGANNAKLGLFEQANLGTLFLDEIGEMPIALQAKLLRVLEDGTFYRLGSSTPRKADVRIIAATNANLKQKIINNSFREDLYYRLNVVSLHLEPLKDRGDDITLLANYFLSQFQKHHNRPSLAFSEQALVAMQAYAWPGNIRELKNCIEKAVVLSKGMMLDVSDLGLPEVKLKPPLPSLPKSNLPGLSEQGSYIQIPFGMPLSEIEALVIKRTLEVNGGDKNDAAKSLGINVRTIYRKLEAGL